MDDDETPHADAAAVAAAAERLAAARKQDHARGFERILRALTQPPKLTRRRAVRERKARNKRRRELWLAMSRKKDREREERFNAQHPEYGRFKSFGRGSARALGGGYYDREGWPMSMRSWCLAVEGMRQGAKHVALTKALDDPEVWVSTVWLGMDHNWNFNDETVGRYQPIIFETMIFGGPLDQDYQTRYYTEAEARIGHERAVEVARLGVMPEDEDVEPPINAVIRTLAERVGLPSADIIDIAGLRDDDEQG